MIEYNFTTWIHHTLLLLLDIEIDFQFGYHSDNAAINIFIGTFSYFLMTDTWT